MKKPILVLLLAATTALSISCSDDDGDSQVGIVGTWVFESSITINDSDEQTTRDVWQFDANNTGTYSESTNGDIDLTTTFTWSADGDAYAVDYASDEIDDESYTIGDLLGQATLEDGEGSLVAMRE